MKSSEYKTYLVARRYSPKLVKSEFGKVSSIPRHEACKKAEKSFENEVIFTTPFNPGDPKVSQTINRCLHISIISSQMVLYSDVCRFHLGRPVHAVNPHRSHHEWHRAVKFSKFLLPDALKMHSLILPVLRFFVKPFPNYLRLHYEKLFFVNGFLKIQIFK